MSEKLLVIDGHSMAYRAFFALPADSFTAAGGQHTNAVYGFLSMLVKLLDTEKPDLVAVAFDPSRHSFRTEIYPEYKGTRDKTPEEFVGQVELIEAVLEKMGVRTITVENFEADDVLATLSTVAKAEGMEVLIASGDRDTFQLVNDRVTVLYPGRSASDLNYMTPEAVEAKYDVRPAAYPELAALVGEASDNLPGIPGVGPKTAAQWLAKFGGLESLLERADEVGGKRGEALRQHIPDVLRNRKLNHLVTDMPLDVSPEECRVEEPDLMALASLFDTLEFGQLRTRVHKAMDRFWGTVSVESGDNVAVTEVVEEAGPTQVVLPDEVVVISSERDLAEVLEGFADREVALWGSGHLSPTSPRLDVLALATDEAVVVVDSAEISPEQDRLLGEFLADHPRLVVHGGKALAHGLIAQGWHMAMPAFDTEIAAYICNPNQRDYGLGNTTEIYLGSQEVDEDDGAMFSVDAARGETDLEEQVSPAHNAAALNAVSVLALVKPLRSGLEERHSYGLLKDIEIPVSMVLFDMEFAGIAVDTEVLEDLRKEYAGQAEKAAEDAYAAIGHEVNLGSPKQLQVVLFEELGMPKTRKTKTGYTTDAGALEDLFAKTGHPFLEALLRHRDRIKLVQTLDGLLSEVQPDGRIHSTFSQIASATGRLASSDPNLQNIPARTESGLRIREAFVVGEGFSELMSIDYSQIEMRIMAHLSEDEALIAAFNSGEDLHATMAAWVFDVPISEVDSVLRNRIKATSYGLAYGLSPFGLSKQLGISVEEARRLHHDYFDRFGRIGQYLREVVEQARIDGYTQTMFGRRRYFPDLESSVRRVRDMAERAALNAPIQGTAADIFKVAMIAVQAALLDGDFQSRMVLQVHDELVLEVAPGEADRVRRLVADAMGGAVKMSVPLDVAVGEGDSWRAAAH
ncbi:DNA polymerase I [Actinomyces minihominis]|uniref:DNA polymerase I n=1 Tax=Actinomyces minihominis TaxID=2002838 RepID=UPI000C07855C|nr:DNA polymerase I [Actinomyces minihominis]